MTFLPVTQIIAAGVYREIYGREPMGDYQWEQFLERASLILADMERAGWQVSISVEIAP